MASTSSSNPDKPALTATYDSPTGTESFKHSVASLSSAETDAKVTYLSELRACSKRLQDDINAFLTAKMEEDKATVSMNSTGAGSGKKAEPSEEEAEDTYGEENEDESS